MLSEMGELSESMRLFGAQFGQGSLVSTISDQNPKPWIFSVLLKRRNRKVWQLSIVRFSFEFLHAFYFLEYIGIRNVKEVQEIYSF